MLQYFVARKNFIVTENNVAYKNPDTGVYFSFTLRYKRNFLLQKNVVSAEFEINYYRPSFFGVEGERELSAFVVAFEPRIEDPQMHGMGEGPYSGAGFLKGWNFGNVFAVRNALSHGHDQTIVSMPAERLHVVWTWNDQRGERKDKLGNRCFIPMIIFFRIEGLASCVAAWPREAPILLPKADFVLVDRLGSGATRFGLAPWSEVLDVTQRAGFDTAKDPLSLTFLATPAPIATWFDTIPLIDVGTLERLSVDSVLDDELIAAARESIARDQAPSGSA